MAWLRLSLFGAYERPRGTWTEGKTSTTDFSRAGTWATASTSTAVHVLAPRLPQPRHRHPWHLVLTSGAQGCTWLETHRAPCKPMYMTLRTAGSTASVGSSIGNRSAKQAVKTAALTVLNAACGQPLETYLTAAATTSAAHCSLPLRAASSSAEAESAGLEAPRAVWRPCTSPAEYVRGAMTVHPKMTLSPPCQHQDIHLLRLISSHRLSCLCPRWIT